MEDHKIDLSKKLDEKKELQECFAELLKHLTPSEENMQMPNKDAAPKEVDQSRNLGTHENVIPFFKQFLNELDADQHWRKDLECANIIITA